MGYKSTLEIVREMFLKMIQRKYKIWINCYRNPLEYKKNDSMEKVTKELILISQLVCNFTS